MKKILTIALLGIVLFVSSCGKNDCDATAATKKYTDALEAWSNDPTNEAKCKAALAAANKFIDEADDCSAIPEASISAAKASLVGFNCK